MDEPKGLQSGAGGTVEVEFRDTVAVLKMKCGENRINPSFLDKMNTALDKVESNSNIRALVTTGEPGTRFFCNGLDLKWIRHFQQSKEGYRKVRKFRFGLKDLLTRYLTFPMPTIAAINGHAFAGGAFISLCNDYRVMQTDKGWWSINEVLLGMSFNQYLQEVMRTKLPQKALRDGVVFGRRFTGPEALQSGVVDKTCRGPELVQQAVLMAKELTDKQDYNRSNIRQMKQDIYGNIVNAPFDPLVHKL